MTNYFLRIPGYAHHLAEKIARERGISINDVYRKIFYYGTESLAGIEERQRLMDETFKERIEAGNDLVERIQESEN